jgi:hypothetical protein
MERGTVSMRVAFVLRSVEVQPLFRDLLVAASQVRRSHASLPLAFALPTKSHPPPPTPSIQPQKTTNHVLPACSLRLLTTQYGHVMRDASTRTPNLKPPWACIRVLSRFQIRVLRFPLCSGGSKIRVVNHPHPGYLLHPGYFSPFKATIKQHMFLPQLGIPSFRSAGAHEKRPLVQKNPDLERPWAKFKRPLLQGRPLLAPAPFAPFLLINRFLAFFLRPPSLPFSFCLPPWKTTTKHSALCQSFPILLVFLQLVVI